MSIAQQGAVVSEISTGTAPDGGNSPGRNRIIGGRSLGAWPTAALPPLDGAEAAAEVV